ncbi:hypothetical protein UPYG_G00069460 [Umbra pygmaea]|uniref:Uncharacterized protein n=1 Tax=Umbra pygmaea TaxID=75934 RepID=A0ABD0XB90_UMBPY
MEQSDYQPIDSVIKTCPSSSCSKAPPQHDAATPVLHSLDGVLQLASFPLFPPNITMVIMAKQLNFVSSDQRTFVQKVQSLSPCTLANHSLAIVWWFWSSGFFLTERPFRLCWYRPCVIEDFDTFVPVFSSIFTRSFAVVLGLILICTFCTKVS